MTQVLCLTMVLQSVLVRSCSGIEIASLRMSWRDNTCAGDVPILLGKFGE